MTLWTTRSLWSCPTLKKMQWFADLINFTHRTQKTSKVSAEKLYNAKKKYWLILNLRAGTYLLKVGPCFPLCRVPLLLTTACNFVWTEDRSCRTSGRGTLPGLLRSVFGFTMLQMFSAGRPLRHLHSSTEKPCCWNGCSLWFSIILQKHKGLPWTEHMLL